MEKNVDIIDVEKKDMDVDKNSNSSKFDYDQKIDVNYFHSTRKHTPLCVCVCVCARSCYSYTQKMNIYFIKNKLIDTALYPTIKCRLKALPFTQNLINKNKQKRQMVSKEKVGSSVANLK